MSNDNLNDIENILNSELEEASNESQKAEGTANKSNKSVLIILLVIVAVLVGVSTFVAPKLTPNITNNGQPADELVNNTMDAARQQMGDDFYKAATDGSDAPTSETPTDLKAPVSATTEPTVSADKKIPPPELPNDKAKTASNAQKAQESFVTIDLSANVGRANPFVPTVSLETFSNLPKVPTTAFPPPPTMLIEDNAATKLMQTTISGIMYDAFSPSAIISVEGQDHLVRKGDRINGYKVLDITKDRVIVQNGTNVYRATVGETLTTQSNVEFNKIDNLPRMFGGRYTSGGTTMIQIN